MKRVALYTRVSTGEQTTANQRRELERVAKRCGWRIVATYSDNGSGAHGREKRPGFDRLLTAITRREVDLVAAWSVDRLARSLKHLLSFLEELQAKRCDLYLHTSGLDTSTPGGRALFQMLGVFSELERSMIRERVKAGLARARSEGVVLGRPRIPQEKEEQIRKALNRGLSVAVVARQVGCGRGTCDRVRRESLFKMRQQAGQRSQTHAVAVRNHKRWGGGR